MKGTRAKGNRLELERQRQFEAAGALVLRAPMKMVRIGPGKDDWIMTSADFFGVADLLVSWKLPASDVPRFVVKKSIPETPSWNPANWEPGRIILDTPAATFYAGQRHLLVSVTTLTNVAARRKKMGARAEELIRFGWACEVHARADRKPWRAWRAQLQVAVPITPESRAGWIPEDERSRIVWTEVDDYLPKPLTKRKETVA